MVATPTVWAARHMAGVGIAAAARLAGAIGDLCRNHPGLTEFVRVSVSRSRGHTSGHAQAPPPAGGSAIHASEFMGITGGLRMTQTAAP